ncbi:MAG: tyrosyl-tRNA synthetase [Chloroflexota bacterium]|nr:tyrosyl-tRNA synthetase [Chloroflexota bacterium]
MAADAIDVLRERGFVQQISDEAALRRALTAGAVTAYCGYDPTAASLHVGHLLTVMVLSHLQRAGHRPIAVVGGGTGMIGDPTGRTEMRQLLGEDAIAFNVSGLRAQLEHFLDFGEGRAIMANNADWLLRWGYIEFLREIGRYFSVNQLLQHSTYRDRIAGEGLSFIELNYALLQAYDYLHLYREYGCTLQIGGADQWFNILEGTDLIRRVEGAEAFALVSPLITTASGAKMGKSAGNSVWLDPALTSPYAYYQYWINTEDADVERFLALFTYLPMDEVRRLGGVQGAELRAAKEILAFEQTKLVHGEVAAEEARAASRALFGGDGDAAGAPSSEVDEARLAAGVPLVDLLVETGLARSKREARDLVKGNGISMNGARVEDPNSVVSPNDLRDGSILLRRGQKSFHRLFFR